MATRNSYIAQALPEHRNRILNARTYGDWFEVEEHLKADRDWANEMLRRERRQASNYRAKAERERAKDARFAAKWGEPMCTGAGEFWDSMADAREPHVAELVAFRDELTEALREYRRQDREHRAMLERVSAELAAEREGR